MMKFKLSKKGYISIPLAMVILVGLLVGTTGVAFGETGTKVEEITFDFDYGEAYSVIPGPPDEEFSATFHGNMLTKPNGEVQIKTLKGIIDWSGEVKQIHIKGSKVWIVSNSSGEYYLMPVEVRVQESGGELMDGVGTLVWHIYYTGGGLSLLRAIVVSQTEAWDLYAIKFEPPTITPR